MILLSALFGALAACGPVRSTVMMIQADEALREARALGAAETAPFPVTLAEELLRKAHEEQGYSSYDTATQLASDARVLALDAAQIVRDSAAPPEEAAAEEPAAEEPAP